MKKALLIYGGSGFHQPKDTIELFVPFLKENSYSLEMHDNIDIYEDKRLGQFDIIIQNYGESTISKEQEQNLLETVRAGTGFAGWHAGVAYAFHNSPSFQHMAGGRFVSHPPIKEFGVKITAGDDEITKGLDDFKITSEQFYLSLGSEIEPLAMTVFENGVRMPVAWKRIWGSGKVFYLSLGHNVNDFKVPEAMEMMKRGILWATRK